MDLIKVVTRSVGTGLYCPSIRSRVEADVECIIDDNKCIITSNEIPYQITIGEADSEVWDEVESCLVTMKVAEESEFLHKPSGRRYRIKLIAFKRGVDFWKLSANQRMEVAIHHKQQGNELFKQGSVKPAASRYSRALKYVLCISDDNDVSRLDVKELKLQCFLNMSACHLKLCNYPFAIETATKVLLLDNTNVKALYRRGVANSAIGNVVEAIDDLIKAKSYEPSNKTVNEELIRLQKKERDSETVLKDAMKKMFT